MTKYIVALASLLGLQSVNAWAPSTSIKSYLGFIEVDAISGSTNSTAVSSLNGTSCRHVEIEGQNLCVTTEVIYDIPQMRSLLGDQYPILKVECPSGFNILTGFRVRTSEEFGDPYIRPCTQSAHSCEAEGSATTDYIWALCAAAVSSNDTIPVMRPLYSQYDAEERLACEDSEHMAFGVSMRITKERYVYSAIPCGGDGMELCPPDMSDGIPDRLSVAWCAAGQFAANPIQILSQGPFFNQSPQSCPDCTTIMSCKMGYEIVSGHILSADLHMARDCLYDDTTNAVSVNKVESCTINQEIPYSFGLLFCGPSTHSTESANIIESVVDTLTTQGFTGVASAAAASVSSAAASVSSSVAAVTNTVAVTVSGLTASIGSTDDSVDDGDASAEGPLPYSSEKNDTQHTRENHQSQSANATFEAQSFNATAGVHNGEEHSGAPSFNATAGAPSFNFTGEAQSFNATGRVHNGEEHSGAPSFNATAGAPSFNATGEAPSFNATAGAPSFNFTGEAPPSFNFTGGAPMGNGPSGASPTSSDAKAYRSDETHGAPPSNSTVGGLIENALSGLPSFNFTGEAPSFNATAGVHNGEEHSGAPSFNATAGMHNGEEHSGGHPSGGPPSGSTAGA